MIDWTKPIETVPDERNPEPVPCRFVEDDSDGGAEILICGDWRTSDNGVNQGHDDMTWAYDSSGDPHYFRLPFIRNVGDA